MAAAISMSSMAIAPLSIIDLPGDILAKVFDYFIYQPTTSEGLLVGGLPPEDARQRLRDIQNARLACRVLHNFASPHLCPVLSLPLETRSLDVIGGMLKNPFILKGIRVVEVLTMYRPKTLAQNEALYIEHQLSFLERMLGRIDTEPDEGQDVHSATKSAVLSGLDIYDEARTRYYSLRMVWLNQSDPRDPVISQEERMEYQHILQQSYAEYRRKHEEQVRILHDGSFAKAVAMLVSRVLHPCTLDFNDKNDENAEIRYGRNPALLLLDTEELSRFMSSPHDWMTIEALEGEPDLAPAILFSTIPFAVHQEGTTFHAIHVNCFPRGSSYRASCAQSGTPSWDDLASSCKQLRRFTFGDGRSLNCRGIRFSHPQGEHKVFIDRYFGAMLSSSHLECIYLSFNIFNLNNGRGDGSVAGQPLGMNMSTMLRTTDYPLLKTAVVSSISINQVDLEGFCNGIGQQLKRLHISSVELIDGFWVNTVEILRQKYMARCLAGECHVRLYRPFGGEFRPREVRTQKSRDVLRNFRPTPEHPLVVKCRQYIAGDPEVAQNPLR